ncbi:MAG: hypothetical protein KBB94_04400 [Legionellaceae bacterium]|nr:hypothetical protein [Legionellaceae bacterium]MBP9775488.1 hypothetical protein [Legionellaceae bacterium]
MNKALQSIHTNVTTIMLLFLSFGISIFSPKICIAGNDCVILLHGLARTNHSMAKLESTLKKHHYMVVNDNYPSTKKSIEQLANEFIPPMLYQCLKHHPKYIHFVAHSLGGMMVEHYLQTHTITKLGTVIMLSPPNHGSPLADLLHNNKIVQLILGPSIQALTTQIKESSLKRGPYKIGIIAGSRSLNPFGAFIFDEPNDGIVPVSSTKMKPMNDFIVLPVTHTFMMRNEQVITQILCFLKRGHFCLRTDRC